MSASLDGETLDELVRMEAESGDLQCWKQAHASTETRRLAQEYEEAVWHFIVHDLLRPGMPRPRHGVNAEDIFDANAPYLILMTLMGHGVGIWDGSWDGFYAPLHLRLGGPIDKLVDEKLGHWADDMGGGKLIESFRDDAYKTGFGFRNIEWPTSRAEHGADWRAHVEPHQKVYMYAADLYCADDGEAIRADLRREGKAPADEDDEDSYDSDDFPKGPLLDAGGGEADTIWHCAAGDGCLNAILLPSGTKIGAWLGNNLTDDGVAWLCEQLQDPPASLHEHAAYVRCLWAFLYRDELRSMDPPCCDVSPAWGDPFAGLRADEPGAGPEEIVRAIPPTMVERALDDLARIERGEMSAEELARITSTPAGELAELEVSGLQRRWGLPVSPPPPYHPGLPPRLPLYIRHHEEHYGPVRPLDRQASARLSALRTDARQSGHYEGLHYNPHPARPSWYTRPRSVPHAPQYDPDTYTEWLLVERSAHPAPAIRARGTLDELEERIARLPRPPAGHWYAVISEHEYQFARHAGRGLR